MDDKRKDTAALGEHSNARKEGKGVSQKPFTAGHNRLHTGQRVRGRGAAKGQQAKHELRHIPRANPHFAAFNFMQS